jgi:hypothetical protein
MKAFFSELWNLASAALGAAVFLGLMWHLARAHSFQWRIVSKAYSGRATTSLLARKVPETIVITERGARGPLAPGGAGWRNYPGVRIAVHEDGLALSLVPPFNIMCPPLFLPFVDMEVGSTWWGLWPDPLAIRMKRAPKVDMIVAQDTVRWLRDHYEHGPFRRTPP